MDTSFVPIVCCWRSEPLWQWQGSWLPGSREEAVEKWFKASASGYAPGMMAYAEILYKRLHVE